MSNIIRGTKCLNPEERFFYVKLIRCNVYVHDWFSFTITNTHCYCVYHLVFSMLVCQETAIHLDMASLSRFG